MGVILGLTAWKGREVLSDMALSGSHVQLSGRGYSKHVGGMVEGETLSVLRDAKAQLNILQQKID